MYFDDISAFYKSSQIELVQTVSSTVSLMSVRKGARLFKFLREHYIHRDHRHICTSPMSHRRKYSTRKALFLLDYLQIVIMASSLEDVSQAFSRQAARLPDFLFQQRYPRGSNNSINAPNEEGSFLARLGFVSIIVYHAFLIVTRTRNLSHRDGAVKPGRFRFLDRR
jgi:hypothetical protein